MIPGRTDIENPQVTVKSTRTTPASCSQVNAPSGGAGIERVPQKVPRILKNTPWWS